MARLLARVNAAVLDDVAQVAGGVPEGLGPLRLADRVERPDHERVVARPGRRPDRAPLTERVPAEVRPELCAPPRGAGIVGDLDLADAVASVDPDTLERHGSPGGDTRPARGRDDKGPDRHAVTWHAALRVRAGLHAPAGGARSRLRR